MKTILQIDSIDYLKNKYYGVCNVEKLQFDGLTVCGIFVNNRQIG